ATAGPLPRSAAPIAAAPALAADAGAKRIAGWLWSAAPRSRTASGDAGARRARARRLHLRDVHECPLVVVLAAVVDLDRYVLALAHQAHHAADGPWRPADTGATTSASRTAGLRRTTAGERRRIRSTLHGRGTASAAARRRRRSGNRLAGQNGLEVVVSN